MPGSLQAVRHLHFHGERAPFRRSRASSPKGEPLGAAGNFAAAEAFTRRGKVARSAGWGQHPLALLRPLSQALSGLPALPKGEPRALPETLSLPLKAVPLRADFPGRGKMSRSDKRGSVASPQAMTEGVIISSAAFCESAALRGKLLPGASGRNPLGGSRQSRQALTEGVSSSSTIRS